MNLYNRRIFSALWLTTFTLAVVAQSGTNSPYSQYGLGVLADQSQGFNRGMNGLALGMRYGNQVNALNPASYSAIDSLTFIFDVGASIQNTNFKENSSKVNAKNADFEYAVGAFRLLKGMGVSFGLLPYTNIGYNYYNSRYIGTTQSTYYTNTYSGSGGIHQAFLGAGLTLFKPLSIGANFSFLWGDYSKSLVNSYSDSYVKTLSRYYTASITGYKIDLGMQYILNLDKKNSVVIGVTYGLGHKLNSTPTCMNISTNSSTSQSDTVSLSSDKKLSIPHTFAVGFSWRHNNQWTVGADYSFQKWGSVSFPEIQESTNNSVTATTYKSVDGLLKDRHKITLGGEYIPNENSRNFFSRIHYRFGMSYATPYIKVNGVDGPKEVSVSAGLGIPLINTYSRSLLNISGQWVRSSAKDLITENCLRINIGITFNERWFMKWKVE